MEYSNNTPNASIFWNSLTTCVSFMNHLLLLLLQLVFPPSSSPLPSFSNWATETPETLPVKGDISVSCVLLTTIPLNHLSVVLYHFGSSNFRDPTKFWYSVLSSVTEDHWSRPGERQKVDVTHSSVEWTPFPPNEITSGTFLWSFPVMVLITTIFYLRKRRSCNRKKNRWYTRLTFLNVRT